MKALMVIMACLMMAGATGCAYGHAVRVGKNRVLVLKNDGFLFGLLRKAHLCEVGSKGLKNCTEDQNP